jgi:uncharacterized membrane protein
MFQALFKYPWTTYQKGTLLFLSGWSGWLLIACAVAAAAAVWWLSSGKGVPGWRALALGALQWGALALLLLMLWQPALSVSVLKPQRNVVAVLVDDSQSMALEGRLDSAKALLGSGLLADMRKKFPVRLYSFGSGLKRVESADALQPVEPVTRLGLSLREAASQAATLPVGAIVLLTDGAGKDPGLDAPTLAALRAARIPVHVVGFGSERMGKDIEVSDAELPARALPDARLAAAVSLRQSGFAGQRAKITVRSESKVLGSREVTLQADGVEVREMVPFQSGAAGVKALTVSVEPLKGETNSANNAVTRLTLVEDQRPRLLYFEGEPRWELKFIRRAAEEDHNLRLVSILRTTPNKFYRQGIEDPKELEQGFPDTVDALFAYDGLIIGTVEASYFTPAQQSLMKEFVSRRGGGILFLGGRASLSDGGWAQSQLAELLPVELPDRKNTFHRDPAAVELTVGGRDSLMTRLDDAPEKSEAQWRSLPRLADYQEVGAAKPGATVLAESIPASGGRFPLLVTQNFGRGRMALLATGGSWRWRMGLDSRDRTHEMIWRQLLRWVAGDAQGRVMTSLTSPVYSDEQSIPLRAEVRDRNYLPAGDAVVQAHVMGPGGVDARVELRPVPNSVGAYAGAYAADKPGTYTVEVAGRRGDEDAGRGGAAFLREDGVAEKFRTEQNRELLERLALSTGGRYYTPGEGSRLASEIEYSEAGITTRESKDIWNAPAMFLALIALKSAEWLLRRRWGAV